MTRALFALSLLLRTACGPADQTAAVAPPAKAPTPVVAAKAPTPVVAAETEPVAEPTVVTEEDFEDEAAAAVTDDATLERELAEIEKELDL